MNYVLIPLAILALLGCVAAAGQDRYIVSFAQNDDGMMQVFSIPRAEVRLLPSWNPGIDDPPLSVGEAVSAAMKWINKPGNGNEELPLADIHLTSKKSIDMPDVWFYHILFSTSPKKITDVVKSMYVVILMDGRVVSSDVMTEKEFEDLLQRR